MRHMLLAAALAVVPVGGVTAPALAADMPDYLPPIIEAPEPLPFNTASGWYLRGDIGYKIYTDPKGFYDEAGYGAMSKESLDDTGVIGLGAGYRVNEYLRLDGTLDYEWSAGMTGYLPCPNACGNSSKESADLSAITGLVNVYADLGTYAGVTPYVGAGAGFSYLMTSDVTSTSPGTYRGDDTWNFAWALMAGASYQISEQMALDLNYRYLNLGDAKTRLPANANATTPIEWNDIAAHEIRLGLRYNLY